MRTVITVYKDRKGYVIIVNSGKSEGHTCALESHNPEVAAEAALESWEEQRDPHPSYRNVLLIHRDSEPRAYRQSATR